MFDCKGGKNGGAERLAYVNLGQHKEPRSLQPTGNAWLKMIMMMANVALHFLSVVRTPTLKEVKWKRWKCMRALNEDTIIKHIIDCPPLARHEPRLI